MSWQSVTAEALIQVTAKKVIAIAAANAAVMLRDRPAKVIRKVDGDANATDAAIKLVSTVVYQYVYLTEIVATALQLLKEKSPVGSGNDPHAGKYRDSHFVFLNGVKVDDVSGWQPGQVIHISNPVPYSRKIETGRMKTSVPGHVYEDTAQVLGDRYGNSASIRFVYIPVSFGDIAEWASTSSYKRPGRSKQSSQSDMSRQPALQIKAL